MTTEQTPTKYLANKSKRESFLFRIEPTGEAYHIAGNGVKLTSKELDQYYPLAHKVRAYNPDKWKGGDNLDGTRRFLY